MRESKTKAQRPIVARLQVNPGGYAFAARHDGEGTVFIPPKAVGIAIDGDEVEVDCWEVERGFEGSVLSVLERRRARITGMLRQAGRSWVLEPDDPRILHPVVLHARRPGIVETGKVVVARILEYPAHARAQMVARVERVLGPPDTIATEQQRILIENDINPEFPDEVIAEAKEVPTHVLEGDLEGRVDLRGLPFMTIDPDDARDFDDAVCVELLGDDPVTADARVHIAVADVSHYVRAGSEIDKEASIRGFSTYLPNRAIPMLPEALSTHMCSLVPEEDRLAMVATMRVNPAGDVSQEQVRAAVIHSQRRLTYGRVAEVLDDERRSKLPGEIQERVRLLRRVADRMRANRLRRGAIELNLPENKIILDEDDPERIRDIIPSRASKALVRAYNLIEEYMLAANEAVARVAARHKLPLVYRVHDRPDENKLSQFALAAESLGVRVDPDRLRKPRGMQKFLNKIESKQPERAGALNMLLLRAMAQAEYLTDNLGHFALASKGYAHFTSPIRRYPDVLVHRVLKAYLKRARAEAGPAPVPAMPRMRDSKGHAARCSERERVSMQAERECRRLYAAAYMRERLGDRFEAVITGFSSNAGVFVAIKHPAVDGLVRLASLEKERRERYILDETGVRMRGDRSGRVLMLGDRVIVEAIESSMQRRKVEFALIQRLTS